MKGKLCKNVLVVMMIGILGILGLTGCQSEDPEMIFKEAQMKNADLDSVDMNLDMILSIENEETAIIRSKTNSKFSGLKEKTNILMQMKTVFSYESGEDADSDDAQENDNISMNYHYVDGFYYMDMMGQKSKYAMSVEEIIKQVESSIQLDNLQVDALDDLTVEKSGNVKVLNYTLKPENATSITDSVQSQLKTLLSNAEVDIVIESGSGIIKVNEEGYITEQSVKMVCKASVESEETTLGIDMNIIINNPGQEITVEKPVDADYTEIK